MDSLIQEINTVFCPSLTVFLERCHKRGRTGAVPNNAVLGSGFCSRTEQVQTAIQVPVLLTGNTITYAQGETVSVGLFPQREPRSVLV